MKNNFPTDRQIGMAFVRARRRKGWTQRDAAYHLNITAVHLCNVEKGASTASIHLLRLACRLYNGDLWRRAITIPEVT